MRSACAIHVRSSATRPSRVRAVVVAWIAGSPPTMSRSAPGARSDLRLLLERAEGRLGIAPLADELEPHDGAAVGCTRPHDGPLVRGLPPGREAHAEVEIGMEERLAIEDAIGRPRADGQPVEPAQHTAG